MSYRGYQWRACGGLASRIECVLVQFGDSSVLATHDALALQSARGSTGAGATELYDDPHRLLVTLLVGDYLRQHRNFERLTVLVASYLSPGPAVVATTVVTAFSS